MKVVLTLNEGKLELGTYKDGYELDPNFFTTDDWGEFCELANALMEAVKKGALNEYGK